MEAEEPESRLTYAGQHRMAEWALWLRRLRAEHIDRDGAGAGSAP